MRGSGDARWSCGFRVWRSCGTGLRIMSQFINVFFLDDVADALALVGWVSPDGAEWFRGRESVTAVFARRPSWVTCCRFQEPERMRGYGRASTG